MDGGGEKFGAGGFGGLQLGFQGVAQRQQLGHLRDDSLLLRQRGEGELEGADMPLIYCLLTSSGDEEIVDLAS